MCVVRENSLMPRHAPESTRDADLSSAKTRSGRHLFDKVLVMQSGEDRFRAHEVPLPAAVA